MDLNSNNKRNFSHVLESTKVSNLDDIPKRPAVQKDDSNLSIDDFRIVESKIDDYVLIGEAFADDKPVYAKLPTDAYSLFAQHQTTRLALPFDFDTGLSNKWSASRLQKLPNEVRHMVYQSILLEPQTFSILEAMLKGPFVTICDAYVEIEEEISQGTLVANSKNEVHCLPWRRSHVFIPQTTEFQIVARAVESLDELGSWQLDQYELATWDAFILSSPLVRTIRQLYIEVEFPHLIPSSMVKLFSLTDNVCRTLTPLFHGLKSMPEIERFTVRLSCPNVSFSGNFNIEFLDLAFTIWDMFWCQVVQKQCHPGYVSLYHLRTPEIRLAITGSSTKNAGLDEILPGKFAVVDPVQYPWYDTNYFEDLFTA